MNPIRISLCFLLAALFSFAQNEDPRALIQQAVTLQQQGDFEGAAKAYRAFVKIRPNEVGARSNLGVVLVKLGRYDEAIGEYQIASQLAPADFRIAMNLGLALVKSGRLTEAAANFEKLHQQFPAEKQVTLLLADTQLQSGNDARVIELLRPLAQTDASDLSIAYMLGIALLHKQQIAESQVFLDRILSNGDTAEARFLMGTQMFERGNYPAAVEKLSGAVALNPDLPGVQSLYGRALLATGDPDAARSAFRHELSINPNDFPANLALAQILVARKQYTEAQPIIEHACSLRPKSPEAMISHGELLAATGHFSEARAQFESARALAPDSVDVHRDLASLYARLKLTGDAAREQAQVAKLEKHLPQIPSGPKPNEFAPDFSLPSLSGDKTVSLSDFRGKTPVTLVFGSYSCPNFRSAAASLMNLEKRYGSHIPFLLVYIREAHTGQTWESTRNARDGITLQPAATFADKQEHASLCVRSLHLNFPAVVDGMDGSTEQAYAAWPSLVVVVGKDGRVIHSTRLTELDYNEAKMQQALNAALPTVARGTPR